MNCEGRRPGPEAAARCKPVAACAGYPQVVKKLLVSWIHSVVRPGECKEE